MIISNPIHKDLLTEEKLRELEELIFCERFISLDRAVEYSDDVKPLDKTEDRFVEYEWPKDKVMINYLAKLGELDGNKVVFKRNYKVCNDFFSYDYGRRVRADIEKRL